MWFAVDMNFGGFQEGQAMGQKRADATSKSTLRINPGANLQSTGRASSKQLNALLGVVVVGAFTGVLQAGYMGGPTPPESTDLQLQSQMQPLTIYSANGFAPLATDQPNSAFGFSGGSGRGNRSDGTVSKPFDGWADFALTDSQSVTVQWNFTSISPDQYETWSIVLLSNPNQVLAGMRFSADQGTSLGAMYITPGIIGSADMSLLPPGGTQLYRVNFSGISLGIDQSDMVGATFTSSMVPSPGPLLLMGVAGLISKRRRK